MGVSPQPLGGIMTEEERAYIAGFFDGEGCVSLNGGRLRPRIEIGQKHPATLQWIHRLTNCGYLRQRVATKSGNAHHVLTITRPAEMMEFIRIIYPYSRLKRGKLRVAYSVCKTIGRSGVLLGPDGRAKRRRLAEEFKSLEYS